MRIVIEVVRGSEAVYVAKCPSLPGCIVIDSSLAEAQKRMHHAVQAYLASLDVIVPEKLELQVLEPPAGLTRSRPTASG
jgi:predicted RNase H-like HicB family nuclease